MINTLRLSIILPCYNVEKYIAECLVSLFSQDIPICDFEVICVNDCSIDGTRSKILEFKGKYTNIILVDHEYNKKQGEARNSGLRISKGKYIWFVDPDDYIEKNVFGLLLNEVELNNLDVLNFEFYRVSVDNTISKNNIAGSTGVIKGKDFIHSLSDNWQINGSVSRKLYKRELLISNKLSFSPVGYLEDQSFSLSSVYYANRFKHIETYCYYYRFNPDSTLNTKMTSDKYLSIFRLSSDLFKFSHELEEDDKKLYSSINEIALWYLNSVLNQFIYLKNNERKTVITFFKEEVSGLLKRDYFKGSKLMLLSNLEISNKYLFFISPLFRLVRQFKRKTINKLFRIRLK